MTPVTDSPEPLPVHYEVRYKNKDGVLCVILLNDRALALREHGVRPGSHVDRVNQDGSRTRIT